MKKEVWLRLPFFIVFNWVAEFPGLVSRDSQLGRLGVSEELDLIEQGGSDGDFSVVFHGLSE